MAIVVTCAACGREIKAAANLAGMIVRCPDCREQVIVPGTVVAPAAMAAAPAPAGPMPVRPAERVFADVPPIVTPTAAASPTAPIAAAGSTPPAKAAPEQLSPGPVLWYVKPPHGPTLGPVPRTRLDEWAQDARFPPDSRIWADGSPQSYWAGDLYTFLVPSGAPPPNLDPVTAQPLNADAYVPRPADDGRAAREDKKRRKQEQRKVRRAAAMLDALPVWTWWVAAATCLMVLSLAASAISASLATLAAALWMTLGVGLFSLAFMLFALTLYDDDWFLFFLLAMERISITCMVVWNLRSALSTDNPVYIVAYASSVILSVTFIPIPMISIWFVITRWDDAGICILLQFFGLLCFVCIPLMMFVASFAGHAIFGAAMGQ